MEGTIIVKVLRPSSHMFQVTRLLKTSLPMLLSSEPNVKHNVNVRKPCSKLHHVLGLNLADDKLHLLLLKSARTYIPAV